MPRAEENPQERIALLDVSALLKISGLLQVRGKSHRVERGRHADQETGQMMVIAAGHTAFGTAAAGEFLTSESNLEEIAKLGPPDWRTKNMELVISTTVIDGVPAMPHIATAHFW